MTAPAPPAPPTSPGKGASRRLDASMNLLTQVLERPLDSGYAAMAERRVAQGLPASSGSTSWRFGVAMLVAGCLLGVSAATLRDSATARSGVRADLVHQIEAGRAASETKGARINALNAEIAVRDAELLGAQDPGETAKRAALGAESGAVAVTGPGLVVTIDNAPDTNAAGTNADPRANARAQDGVVRARDLQIITNGLWAAGAEAISINGHRLTARTALRFAGEALVVNYRPLSRPYVISAIGDPATMPSAFAGGAGGTYLSTLQTSFGIAVHTATTEDLSLPASAAAQTRVAQPLVPAEVTTEGGTPSSTASETSPSPAPTASSPGPSPSASGGRP